MITAQDSYNVALEKRKLLNDKLSSIVDKILNQIEIDIVKAINSGLFNVTVDLNYSEDILELLANRLCSFGYQVQLDLNKNKATVSWVMNDK